MLFLIKLLNDFSWLNKDISQNDFLFFLKKQNMSGWNKMKTEQKLFNELSTEKAVLKDRFYNLDSL
jgi:hypothetical protein